MKKIFTLIIFGCLTISPSIKLFSQINLQQGLVAHYPFDGDVKDYSGNNNDGTIIGSPSLATDKWGRTNMCYNFNGTGDYIRVEHDSTIQPKEAISVSAWVNADDFSSWLMVVCKRNHHASTPGNSYILYASGSAGSNQSWGFGAGSSSTETFAISPAVAQTQQWVHLVGTYDKNAADSNIRMYVDGSLVKVGTANYDLAYSDSSLRIGMAIPGNSLQYFKGKIDDVRIYNRAINEQEVTALFNNTNTSVKNVNSNNSIQMFPNPASDVLFISGAIDETHTLYVYDMLGKNIIANGVSTESQVNISSLTTGIYTVKLVDGNGGIVYSDKLIVR
jgi:hypothetical protein